MGRTFLLANPGSASRRYAFYRAGKPRFTAHFDAERRQAVFRRLTASGWEESLAGFDSLSGAAALTLEFLARAGEAKDPGDIDAWGLRIVAPGAAFQKHRLLDNQALAELEAKVAFAPLHLGPALDEIHGLAPLLGGRPLVGLSDSAFHATLPDVARLYAIPGTEAERLDLYRFGYHGLSVQSVVRRSVLPDGSAPRRMLVCHLGGGSSITAVKEGKSMDTSMGFSPMEGLIMATRAGDIDAGAVLRLAGALGPGLRNAEDLLQTRSGLLGISGRSSDVRDLLALEAEGDRDARRALDAYAYRARKYIGAYTAVLGGLDMIVFTAGIGEHSPEMRARICGGLEAMGIRLDDAANREARGKDSWLHAKSSAVAVRAMETRELDEMAHIMREVVDAKD